MNYNHPSIVIETPAPGHFVIRGHNPKSVFIDKVGHVVPPDECYITPEVPSEALVAILEERGVSLGDAGEELSRSLEAAKARIAELEAQAAEAEKPRRKKKSDEGEGAE